MTVQAFAKKLIDSIEKVMVGKRDSVELAVSSLLCQGHLLIDDVPGVGKTMLARSIARSIGCTFNRIQFTPDMLPSDITGVSIYNQKSKKFEFRAGPIMAQIVLADEINRATPKTQSALLEAMQEAQVSIDGVTHELPKPFMVLATQNPIEYEGTFQLPEAQLDRFLLRIKLGYPEPDDEVDVLKRQQFQHPFESLDQVVTAKELLKAQEQIKAIYTADSLQKYIVELVNKTRNHSEVYLGASPRGSLALYRASQARAAMEKREFVLPDDVKALALPALSHRIIMSPAARLRDLTAEDVVQEILDTLPVPGGNLTPQ
ncbi:MAG: MoxR family ATPase [Anaerolineae bacterium]|nr:MoxR family ATPase [Anaerolineae bacterium]MDK1081035.1 MoxR family ATPase [Anaerolineae bacterium]MDK1118700.1 MoxR family ATPase [Anaerolineae bacterium]